MTALHEELLSAVRPARIDPVDEVVLDAIRFVTITGPDEVLLPWSCTQPHRHSGSKGCRLEPVSRDWWVQSCRRRWSALRRAIDADRIVMILEEIWEPQKRGVPHLHLLVKAGPGSSALVERLRLEATAHGFGFVDSPRPLTCGLLARLAGEVSS